MRRLLMVLTLVLIVSQGSLWAQDFAKADVFGGFSVLHFKVGTDTATPLGWQAGVTANVSKVFGLVGDFSGQYKDGAKYHSFLGGVQVTHRVEKASVFAQAKWGGLHNSDSGDSENHFQMGYGGGIDYHATPKVSIRVIQFDWLPTKDQGEWLKNITRFGFGVVFHTASK